MKTQEIMTEIFLALSILFLLMSVLPSFRITHWSVKTFDYIRIQLLFIQLIVLIGSFFLFKNENALIYLSQLVLFISVTYQLHIVLPYLSISFIFKGKESANNDDKSKEISIISSNVLQKNQEYHKLIELVRSIEPDILLTTETNKEWEEALKVLEDDFSFNHKIALENRYGMHFYTKLKAIEIKEHFLLSEETPSIEAELEDNKGNRFVFWGIHPPPPSPTEKPTSKQNDAELMKVAKLIAETGYPSIVVGDFNDVCWSKSTKLFAKISKLKDVRLGRGIIGTFPVKLGIFRFPLDLIFASKEITVTQIKRLPEIGSDHLPLLSKFSVLSSSSSTSKKMVADLKQEADDIIEEGHKAVEEEEGDNS